jgi:DNA adenine methylase
MVEKSRKRQKLRSPIVWFGGKGSMVAKLLPFIPKHKIYVEPYGGGASLLFAHEPSEIEVYNDLNSGLVNLFRVLRNREQFEQFHRLVQLTPYAREEFFDCKNNWSSTDDPVERAYRWFVVARMSFAGAFGQGWSFGRTSSRGMESHVSAWLGIVEMLPEISQRLSTVLVEHKDAFGLIQTYDTEETFFYLDPPYVLSTRKAGGYKHELSDADHQRLVESLLNIKGKALLSGYANPIYAQLEKAGWQRKDWKTVCIAAGRTRATGILGEGACKRLQERTESIWFNYEVKEGNGELALEK